MISSGDPSPIRPAIWCQCLGWCVHLYTALGLIAAAAIAALIVHGGADSFRRAFLLMVAATLIDATDGTLARRVRIKEVVPGFDGRRLDDLVDFLTYTCLPLLLIWRTHLLPESCEVCLLIPLLASAYGFCQVSAKTDDGYFLGFPSYWNLVAFYLYTLQPLSGWFCAGAHPGVRAADVRAEPLSLSDATRQAEPGDDPARHRLGRVAGLASLEHAVGATRG